ncbi:acetate--CoA ligase family protein [Pistricoccus aurantiacus]|nr:acetate--CoA ligase [Pistricoccus aurantiacus]
MSRISPLHDILAPSGIAIIGASSDPTKRGYKALAGLLEGGFGGDIYPINPKASEILGVPAYASLESLPRAPELALICTPASSVANLIRQCGEKGVKGAVILASGFGETGLEGKVLEQELLNAARESGVRLIGPNTSGLFNLHAKLNLLGLENVVPGNIGIVSQSGNMLLALALEAQHHGCIGFSSYVGPGNQTDLGFGDYLRYLGEDDDTYVAALYVEGFQDGRGFLEVAKEITRRKPVVVYKSGATRQGCAAASSHTGALAGSYAMTTDLLRQAGVSVVQYSDEILPVAEGLGALQQAPGKRVAILADGGGQATIAADRIVEAGLELASLSDTTRARLAEILFPQASLANPVDVAGSSDANPALLARCHEILIGDEGVDSVLLVGMFGGYASRFSATLAANEMAGAESMVETAWSTRKPLVVHSLYAPVRPPALERLREAGLVVYGSIELAIKVLAALAARGEYLARESSPTEPAIEASRSRLIEQALEEKRDLLEPEAKALLKDQGIAVPDETWVTSADQLGEVAAQAGETPMAMKVVSRDILHKSDAGGVRLDLRGAAALEDAYRQIMASCENYAPNAHIDGVLVSPMAAKGVEVIIGVVRDPAFGPVLMFGLGGIFVELLEDVAFRAIPLSRQDAQGMLDQLKASKVLDGLRGAAAVDKAALVELLLKVSQLVQTCPDIRELDLNPVIAYPQGYYQKGYAIVDARIILTTFDKETGDEFA